jgi:hypothetical protein
VGSHNTGAESTGSKGESAEPGSVRTQRPALVLVQKYLLSVLYRAEGFEAEIRRLLSICVEKTSKPIPPNLDKIAHDKELQMKGGCKPSPV